MINGSELSELISCLDYVEYKPFAEAVEENLYIPQSSSLYSLYRTPFFKFVLDRLEDRNTSIIGIMVASQVGKSILLVAIALEWMARNASANVLYYAPDQVTANTLASEKLIPCVLNSPYYANLLPVNANKTIARSGLTRNKIRFVNGSDISIQTAGGKTSLIGRSSPLVILDEYGKMRSLANNISGDVLALAHTRTTAFAKSNRKVIAASSPDMEGETIAKLHSEAKQYSYFIACPHCRASQPLDFACMEWEKPSEGIPLGAYADMVKTGVLPVWYSCPHCKGKILESEKNRLLARGNMVCTGNEHLSDDKISVHLNGLYGVESWGVIVAKYLLAQNDAELLKEFSQQVLAAPWQETAKTRKLKADSMARASICKGEIPENTYRLLCGIDVQIDKLYQVQAAYTTDGKIVVYDWSKPSFDIEGRHLNQHSFPFEVSDKRFRYGNEVEMLLIDAGFNYRNVVELCDQLPRAQAVKGYDQSKHRGQYAFRGNDPNLLHIAVQDTNELLQSYIKSGIIQFPSDMDAEDELITHLTNVILDGGRWVDRKKNCHTDYRDALRYILGFGEYCGYMTEIEELKVSDEVKAQRQAEEAQSRALLSSIFGG